MSKRTFENFLNESNCEPDSQFKEDSNCERKPEYGKRMLLDIWLNGKGIYEGELRKKMAHGYGTAKWDSGAVYIGQFKNDYMHGYGKMTYSNGNVYQGQWVEDMKEGHGEYTLKNGDKYVGEWVEGRMHGHGKMTHSNGNSYVGIFVDNQYIYTHEPIIATKNYVKSYEDDEKRTLLKQMVELNFQKVIGQYQKYNNV
jgi:hypothetical protein